MKISRRYGGEIVRSRFAAVKRFRSGELITPQREIDREIRVDMCLLWNRTVVRLQPVPEPEDFTRSRRSEV